MRWTPPSIVPASQYALEGRSELARIMGQLFIAGAIAWLMHILDGHAGLD